MLQAETATCCSDDPIPQSDSVEQGSLAHGSQERSWKAHHMPRDDFDLGRSDVEWSPRSPLLHRNRFTRVNNASARSTATGIFTSLLAFYTPAVFVVTASYKTVNSICIP